MGALPAVGDIVEFRKLKWPGTIKVSHRITVLGTDEYGLWVGGPAGEAFRLADGGLWVAHADSVACIGPERPWNIWFFAEPRRNLYLDVIDSARWVDGGYEFVDLDLDVLGLEHLEIIDIEELELHADLYGYPPELVDEAWRRASDARRAAESGAEPYATRGWARLAQYQTQLGRREPGETSLAGER